MTERFDEELATSLLDAGMSAVQGNYGSALRHLLRAGNRIHRQQRTDEDLIDAMFEGPGVEYEDPHQIEETHDPRPAISTCTTCGAEVAAYTQRCPHCGGISFLDPAPPE